VEPASPAHMEKLEAEPAAKRKLRLSPTRCNPTSTVASLEPVTPQCTVVANDCENASCGEWPVMNGLEDKQALSALHVQLDRNSGSPKRGDPHGDGAFIVLVGVATHQGVRESLTQEKGRQVLR